MRRLVAGTGWKMNIGAAEATRYGRELALRLPQIDVSAVDIFVLPREIVQFLEEIHLFGQGIHRQTPEQDPPQIAPGSSAKQLVFQGL